MCAPPPVFPFLLCTWYRVSSCLWFSPPSLLPFLLSLVFRPKPFLSFSLFPFVLYLSRLSSSPLSSFSSFFLSLVRPPLSPLSSRLFSYSFFLLPFLLIYLALPPLSCLSPFLLVCTTLLSPFLGARPRTCGWPTKPSGSDRRLPFRAISMPTKFWKPPSGRELKPSTLGEGDNRKHRPDTTDREDGALIIVALN